MTTKPIKIFIVDDHKLIVDGIVSMLNARPDFEVVGWVSSGEEAINSVDTLKPDVVLMDIMLKKMTGLEACRWIKERNREIKVLILSMEVKKEFLSIGIQCGINGYLHKDIDKNTLFEAIETVHSGREYFTDALTKVVFEDFYNHAKLKNVTKIRLPDDLTQREYEVLGYVASGKSTREIADALFVSVKTIETHKAHILDKLGLRNSAELTKYAIKNGIVQV
jgi:DNA-binding NarL/FixJ family response regulator